jgi:uncharacterized membrane protein YbhN (UPF0104 family)
VSASPQGGSSLDLAPAAAAPTVARARRRSTWLWAVLAGLLLLAVAAAISAATVDGDSGRDLLKLAGSTARDIGRLRWQYTAVVVVLASLHYLATAIAARAAAGVPLPLGETLLVQLAAAAANRLTPAGLGGSAVTARYLTRRGLEMPAALGAVTALAVLGALADLLVLTALVLLGSVFGLRGSAHEVGLLTAHITHLLGPLRSPWLWTVVALVGMAALGIWTSRHRSARGARWLEVLRPIRRLARRPGALATLILASGCTTLVLGVAFVATTAMVPGPQPVSGLGALLVAFMLGAAAGSAVPLPAGLGSTEAALIAVLISVQVPAAHAVEEVLIFRLLTFWAPAAVGILATRNLSRRHAL